MRRSIVLSLFVVAALSMATGPSAAEPTCSSMEDCARRCDSGDTEVCEFVRQRLASLCDKKVADACTALGDIYWEGFLSTPVALDRGAALHRQGCELGNGGACNQWAFALAYGHGIPRNDARAVEIWKRGCELGHGLSCGTYGARLRTGRGVVRDDKAAGEILRKACDLEDPTGCRQLGHWHDEQGHGHEARAAWQLACELGETLACDKLAVLGQRPAGVARDLTAAHAEYIRRCDGGEPVSCARAADGYRRGIGVKAKPEIADAIDRRTCDGGFAPSCSLLARLHADKGEMAEADRDFSRACDLGESVSCGEAAAVRRKLGKGHDARSPFAMYQRGCKANDPPSCFAVGTMYQAGTGAKRSLPRALAAYVRACDGRRAEACAAAARLVRGSKAAGLRDKACKLGHTASCTEPAIAPR